MLSVLLTRPRQDNERLARAFHARGWDAISLPLLEIIPHVNAPLPANVASPDGVIVTSRHAMPWLERHAEAYRQLPFYVVGEQTAFTLQASGFAHIASAQPDATSLMAALRQQPLRRFLYLRGADISVDMATRLSPSGFDINECIVYEACKAVIAPDTIEALRHLPPDAALFYSRRTAEHWCTLVEQHNLFAMVTHMTACCLSDHIAEALCALPWQSIKVAPTPDESALLSLLGA